MNIPKSRCTHINTIGDYTKEDIIEKQESSCNTCHKEGPYLWVCLHRNCLYVGCDEAGSNHCVKHFQIYSTHSLFLNLTSLRVYCLLCECEVFLENNDPPLPGMLPMHPLIKQPDSDSEEDYENEENSKPRGLTGLQNLGNTCYMNSAIQALSNCPQLTNFFLECESFIRSEKKPGLSKSYMRLMKEMWHKKRPSYVVPSGIAYGIKIVCPVFRGYAQQDAQEFLRCFMDQLHEELKEPIVMSAITTIGSLSFDNHEEELYSVQLDSGLTASDDSSPSDADYETCDSGLSSVSEKAYCDDEGEDSQNGNNDFNNLVAVDLGYSDLPCTKSKIETENQSSINSSSTHEVKSSLCSHSDLSSKPKEKHSTDDLNQENFNIMLTRDNIFSKSSQNNCEFYNVEKKTTSHICSTNAIHFNKETCVGNQSSLRIQGNSCEVLNSVFNGRKQDVQHRSIVSDIFDGKILSSVQCLTCDTVSTTKETFQDLSLPIPNRDHLHIIHASQGSNQKSGGTCSDVYSHQGWFTAFFNWMLSWFWGPSINLQDCLSAFFSADELKGDNMYSCEKCKKLRNGIKYSKVIELPEVLCIHLKRFRHEVMFSSKINSYVSFPIEGLDMSQFLHKSFPSEVATYDLASVICHHGTAGSGHYTAYSLNYLNEQWYEFDDQYVTAVDAEMVRHCEAYVLFYRKCGNEMIKKRQAAVKLMERSKTEHGLLKFHISNQWINKFNTFAEPGPITNTDFLCTHGGVPPQKAAYVAELCTILPQAVWEYLHDTFGGGPPCTHLYICPLCQADQDMLNRKRKTELDEFSTMNMKFQLEENTTVYALNISWFKIWENFVCREGEIPGQIDNSSIYNVQNNQATLKLESDYCKVSKEMYQYLHNIYGGGPEIILKKKSKVTTSSCSQFPPSTIAGGQVKPSLTLPSHAQISQTNLSLKRDVPSHSHSSNCLSLSKVPCDQM